MDFNPMRRSVADCFCTWGSKGSKSIALQTVRVEHRARVRQARIACRQSCPTAVAFWEGEGGCSTSGSRRQQPPPNPQQRQQEGWGAAPAAAEAVAPKPPAEAAGGVGGGWVDWGECNSCGAIIKQFEPVSHGPYVPRTRSVEPSISTPSSPIRKSSQPQTFSLD